MAIPANGQSVKLYQISGTNIQYPIFRTIIQYDPGTIMPWLCVDHMIQQGIWLMGFSYPDPLANPDPLAKSRPTDKFQTHWLGHKVVDIVIRNIQ